MGYVALGDSYASGEGLLPSLAYPLLLKETGAARFSALTGAARSGAVTGDVLATQVSSLRESTQTVTLTVGGNDAGFATVLAACLHSPDPRIQAVLDQGAPWRESIKAGARQRIAFLGGPAASPQDRTVPLVRVLSDVARRAPDAEILVTGYPRLLGSRPTPQGHRASEVLPLFVAEADAEWMGIQSEALDAALAAGVERAQATGVRARFVDVTAAFEGHALSDRQAPWVNGVVLASLGSLVPSSSSFHLTAEGQAAYASAIAAAVGEACPPQTFLRS
ncbi:GDSL-like Lipase/Acylhydrolase family protein [Microlunatus sagamiharensis]|uniref:GDSL-like Lipase/Acylhydrolase family protein n=1 Tax=Microlunatus sagamiharensis TaxID=546874 RepID=A0A1H2N7S2_9ACTN|nr:SGNH/GDSL hydrolase family protein [Microlunatus sagamiharensis]SDV01278.1 GDSL-like Lipase/Acylhydrolase family protein [Microlunatus sagamiharensis]